jgi:hypothetical protein
MAAPTAWRVLYTKQLTKKHKTYQDGFVVLRGSGAAALLDEAGRELTPAAAPLPPGEDWGDCEGVADVFPGFLVNGDGACAPCEVPGYGGGGAAAGGDGGGGPPVAPAPAAHDPIALAPAARQAFRRPTLAAPAGSGGSGGRGRDAAAGWGGAAAGAAAPAAPSVPARPPVQQHGPPCGGAPPAQPQQQHPPSAPMQQPCGGVRSGACGASRARMAV